MADTNKKEYTSNLHPKGDLDTTVYPNIKSENIIDKDLTSYTAGKVPDSSLVQKSLDSLSENLETTKIEVGANKRNIATLQGDVAGLKQDNQTTKTTIAGLVSDNTQNKQNIENLSAVIPTDINVDSDYNLVLEHDGTEITGQKKNVKAHWDFNNYYSTIFKETLSSIVVSKIDGKVRKGNITLGEGSYDSNLKRADANIKLTPTIDGDIPTNYHYGLIKYQYAGDFLTLINKSSSFSTSFIIPLPSGNSISIRLPNNKSGTLALTSDLDAKQNTLYRHTIEITKDNEATLILTTESTISTEINTMDKFISAFKGSELACMCALNDTNAWNIHFIGIQVGTTINDTSMMSSQGLDTGITFTDVFGTSGYTMVDKVKPL